MVLRRYGGWVPSAAIFYFPPGVDTDVFRQYSAEETDGTYDYLAGVSGIDKQRLVDGKIIFETSRMVDNKRKDLLLDAFAKVVGDHSDAYMIRW